MLAGLPSPAFAADGPASEIDAGRHSPDLIVGGGVGYAHHYGRTLEVDAVSGATTPTKSYSKPGIALNAFADVAAFDVGRGDIGFSAGFTLALPTTFMNVALVPRYKYHYRLPGATLRSIEPSLGVGVALAFRDAIDSHYYLWLPLSAGCDFALGKGGLLAGIAVDVNMINPKGVKSSGHDQHMNDIVALVRLSYHMF
jgi:hypothetical protein